MLLSELPIGVTVWAVDDQGEVIHHHSKAWLVNEFPTQHHVAVTRLSEFGGVHLSNDDLSIHITISEVADVNLAVMAFTALLVAVERSV